MKSPFKNFFGRAGELIADSFRGPSPKIPITEGDPRARLSLSIEGDISNSMAGEKMDQACTALTTSLTKCPEDIEVGLVTFGHRAVVQAGLTYQHRKLRSIVNSLSTKGKTPLFDALKASYQSHIEKSKTETGIVIFTDGKPTEASVGEILSYGDKLKNRGTRIITVGIGENVNESFLRKLASSREDYYFAEAPTDIFSEITSNRFAGHD